jgi:hypothetical protein
MRYSKVFAMMLGAIGASGGILVASSPARASVPSGEIYAPNAPGTQEADWQAAHQTRTIEAIEDFLWRYPNGKGDPKLRLRAIYELASFECVGSNRNGPGVGCSTTSDGRHADTNGHRGYGG